MRLKGKVLLWVAVAAIASLAGCSGVTLNLNPQYLALGDFLTDGATLSDPAEQAYPALVSRVENAPVTNLANSGDQACDVAARQIFPKAVLPTLASHPTFSLLIGVNDVDNQGEGVYEQVFEECHQAAIAWLALPAEDKVLSGSAGFEARGPGQIDITSGWNAWATQGQGSTVSFTIDTAQARPIYAWPLVDDNSAATYSYSLDGVVVGTSSVQTSPHIATQNGTTRSLGFLRWPYIPAGHHTVTFTQTSMGASGVSVVGIGAPTVGQSGQLPQVLVGNVPYQMHTGANVGCQNTDAPCLAYNADIRLDVEMMSGDGLNVRLFDTRQYLASTNAEMSDAVHPNAKGQQELSLAVQAAWSRTK